jgi:hypothetical protein
MVLVHRSLLGGVAFEESKVQMLSWWWLYCHCYDLAVDLGEVKVGIGLHDPQLAFVVNSISCPNRYEVFDLLLMAPVEEVVVELEKNTLLPSSVQS